MTGTLRVIGVGPGDPEPMTLKAPHLPGRARPIADRWRDGDAVAGDGA